MLRSLPLSMILLGISLLARGALATPELLSETGLYQDIGTKKIQPANRYFNPQYPLWTDGADKHRWIFLPGKIHSENPTRWTFPVGTKAWKEFRHNGKRVETRFMEKVGSGNGASHWSYATYLWDEKESDARIADRSGLRDAHPTAFEGVSHDVPGCAAMHGVSQGCCGRDDWV